MGVLEDAGVSTSTQKRLGQKVISRCVGGYNKGTRNVESPCHNDATKR